VPCRFAPYLSLEAQGQLIWQPRYAQLSAQGDPDSALAEVGGSRQCRAPSTESTATSKVSIRSNKVALR
jgi:hypothetical protein